ncbi:MhpC Predicted hydrolases or acyltransferases (alpha/beta hydrolase superfamily) [Burkholderiaceae bacterium]
MRDPVLKALQTRAERIDVVVNGVQQTWHVWNRSHTKPLVLLHGGSGSWTHWVRNIDALSEDHAVWAMDLPGMGDSALPPEAKDADDIAPWVAQGMAQLLGGQAIPVMGFSFGGLTAGFVAARHPERVSRLLLVGVPGLGLFGDTLPLRGFLPNMDQSQRNAVHHHNLMSIMLAHEASLIDQTLEIQERNVVRDRLRRRRIARSTVMMELQTQWRCPVHALWGALDALYLENLSSAPERLNQCNLRDLTLLPDTGHWANYENAKAFNDWAIAQLASPA